MIWFLTMNLLQTETLLAQNCWARPTSSGVLDQSDEPFFVIKLSCYWRWQSVTQYFCIILCFYNFNHKRDILYKNRKALFQISEIKVMQGHSKMTSLQSPSNPHDDSRRDLVSIRLSYFRGGGGFCSILNESNSQKTSAFTKCAILFFNSIQYCYHMLTYLKGFFFHRHITTFAYWFVFLITNAKNAQAKWLTYKKKYQKS